MQTEKRHSYGIIPLIGTPEDFKVLVIEQRDPHVAGYWTFAKGTPEEGEEPQQTAIRETLEEVGISFVKIDTEFSFTESYNFMRGPLSIEKSVTYFAGKVSSENFVLQETEVVSARWCTPLEATALLKFQGAQDVLQALIENGVPSRLLG